MSVSNTMRDQPKLSRSRFFLGATALFLTSFGYCFLVSRVFPYGILQSDTMAYLTLATNFHLFHANVMDWARNIPFGALLRFALLFPTPTIAVYWFYSTIFCVRI